MKYNYFDKEQTSKPDKNYPFKPDTLYYNAEKDFYVCPIGRKMIDIGSHQTKTKTGFTQKITRYRAQNCNG